MLRKKFVGVQITCTASLQECNFSHINLPLPKSDGVIYPRIYSVKSHYKKKKITSSDWRFLVCMHTQNHCKVSAEKRYFLSPQKEKSVRTRRNVCQSPKSGV